MSIKTKNILEMTIVTYPILFRYVTFVPYLMLGELILLAVLMVAIGTRGLVIKPIDALIPFWIFLWVRIFISLTSSDNLVDEVGTGLRVLFVYTSVVILLPRINTDTLRRYLLIIATLVSVYALIQIAFSYLGIILPTELPFLTPLRDADSELRGLMWDGFEFRVRSVFGEPSEMCQYLILPLTILLFEKEKEKGWITLALLFSLVCVVSLSSLGIILVGYLWVCYFLSNKNLGIYLKRYNALLLAVAIVAVAAFIFRGGFEYFMWRTFSAGLNNSTRFKSLYLVFSENFSTADVLIGKGMAEREYFLPGMFRLFFWMGILGLITYGYFWIKTFSNIRAEQRMVLVVFLIISIAGAILFSDSVLLWLSYVLADKKQTESPRVSISNNYRFVGRTVQNSMMQS